MSSELACAFSHQIELMFLDLCCTQTLLPSLKEQMSVTCWSPYGPKLEEAIFCAVE